MCWISMKVAIRVQKGMKTENKLKLVNVLRKNTKFFQLADHIKF